MNTKTILLLTGVMGLCWLAADAADVADQWRSESDTLGDIAKATFVAQRVSESPAVPAAEVRPRRGRGGFGVPIELGPDDKPAFDDPPADIVTKRDDIPYGKLEMIEYDSKTVGTTRKMNVYTPPGYSPDKII